MRKITEITSEYQQIHLIPIDGSDIKAQLTLEFKPVNNAWFFSLSWDTFTTKNEQVVVSQNLLRQYRHILPFGIGIVSKSLVDPVTVEAFSTGDSELYIMSAAEVIAMEADFYG